MTNSKNKTSLRSAALIAGLGLLIMVIAAPFTELFVYPKLVVANNATETVKNIMANKANFILAIFGYLITFICDVVVAWALYVLLKPVNENLSLLTAWFRLVYTVIALVALLHLVNVLQLLNTADYLTAFEPDQLHAQVMILLNAFRHDWYFGLLFFGIHLGLLGYLVFRSGYIPRILGLLLIIAGLGYLITTLKPYLFPNFNSDIARFTFYGELIFMLWLLIKGSRIKESDKEVIWFESISYE
ncbi:MAG TPA: DUF4386 domain-containing protein [Chitinophagaceae bacterium]|nr:DUF4386 domain-containing protein [Chitinophagaceae bacterium]